MTKADEELRERIQDDIREMSILVTASMSVTGKVPDDIATIEYDLENKIMKRVATERKKAVQQFAAEVKGKAKTMIVETMSESRAANRKWIEAVSVTAIDEALESYES